MRTRDLARPAHTFDPAALLERALLLYARRMPTALQAEAQGAERWSVTTSCSTRRGVAACAPVTSHARHTPSTLLHFSSARYCCMLAACPPRCRPKHKAPSGGQLLRAVAHGVVWPHAHPQQLWSSRWSKNS
jgi:hypothetical protein